LKIEPFCSMHATFWFLGALAEALFPAVSPLSLVIKSIQAALYFTHVLKVPQKLQFEFGCSNSWTAWCPQQPSRHCK
jgi:hypothetical protein